MDVDLMERPHRGMPPLVLKLEDDDLLRAMHKQLFASSGLRCIACSRPDEALHVLLAKLPTLITMDYDLPGMPGPELARVIRAVWPDIPFILLTGRTCVETEVRNYFDDVILKGDDPTALVQQVSCLSSKSGARSSFDSCWSLQTVQIGNSHQVCPPLIATALRRN